MFFLVVIRLLELESVTPLSGNGGPNVHGLPIFSAMLLYMASNL